jgi:hypothetical protein
LVEEARAKMIFMSRFRRPKGLTIWPRLQVMPLVMPRVILPAILLALLLALICTAGCDRPADSQSGAAAQSGQPPVPFHDGKATTSPPQNSPATADAGSNPPPNLASNQTPNQAQNPASNSETGLPFHDPANLPAGTLLTVRLKSSISAENPGANGIFEAVVDDPVVIEGNRLVPRGATVVGRVASARASRVKRNRGYIRLALDSIHFAGVSLPIQTSSLFARGSAGNTQVSTRQGARGEVAQGDVARGDVAPADAAQAEDSAGQSAFSQGKTPPGEASPVTIRLEKGRRLTFRLTESAYVAASQRTPADH